MAKVWVSAYSLGEILHAFNVFKQIYITIFKCIINVVALWDFTEFEIIVLAWWQRRACHTAYVLSPCRSRASLTGTVC